MGLLEEIFYKRKDLIRHDKNIRKERKKLGGMSPGLAEKQLRINLS
jgi:hypothetical protein